MINQIDYQNFSPSAEVRAKVEEMLRKLSELSPSDSNLFSRIIETVEGVSVQISVASTRVRLKCLKLGPTVYETLETAIAELEQELFLWKARRFA